MATTPVSEPEYKIVAPSGESVSVPRELYEACVQMVTTRRAGAVITQFKNGGFAGVKMEVTLK